jgi:hypothetical protein
MVKRNDAAARGITFVQTGEDKAKSAVLGFFIKDATGDIFNVDNVVIRPTTLAKLDAAGVPVATKKQTKLAIERHKDLLGPPLENKPPAVEKKQPAVSPVKPVPGLGPFSARIKTPVLKWFAYLAEISDMQEHAFVWRPDGFVLKGYISQDKFVFDIFLDAKDKSVFEQFQAPRQKAAFFYKMKIPEKQKYVNISSSDERPKGSETIENRLQEIADMVDSALEYGIDDYVKIEIDANDMVINTGLNLKENTLLSWYISWMRDEPMLFIHKDEDYIENIKIMTKPFKIDKYETLSVPVPVERYIAMFKNSPVLEKTTLKLTRNGTFIVECSNKAGSYAKFMRIYQ